MGENGKRSRHRRDYDGDSKNQKRRTDRDRDRDRDRDEKGGDDELIVYRILCPDGFIGSVIGKSGKVINSIRQETKARVKVVDPFPGAKDRVITIYCYVKDKEDVEIDGEFDDGEPLCPAQDALIKVHNAIAEAIDSFGDSDKKWKDKEECKILVPSSQSANIIGKSGSTIKRLRSKTRATIKVNPKDATDPTHSCAMEFDNFLVEHGDVGPLWKSLGKSWSFSSRSLKITLPSGWPRNPTAPMVQNLKLKHNLLVSRLKFKTADKKVLAENVKWTTKFERLGSTDACMAVGDYFFKQNTLAQKPQMNEITGDPEAVKKALFAISAIMYKFAPKEEIPLDTNVPEALPNIIIPSDAPIFPPGGLYPGLDPRSVPSMLGAAGIPEFPGYSDTGSAWPVYSSALPVVTGYGGTSRSGELVVRILCPSNTIGRVIGKGGSSIKNVRQASGACVDVDDTKANRGECIITVTSTESTDDLKSVAVEAVLLLQGKINDDEDDDTVSIRLLVPSKVIGCIIGKSGSIINEIRKRTKADIHISKGEKPKCADANDELVEVVGKVGSVRDALVQIVLRLRDDVLKDRDRGHNQSAGADSYYSGGTGLSAHSVLPSVPPVAPVGYEHRDEAGSGLGMRSSSSLYGYGSLSVADDGYGSLPSYSSKLYGGLPPPSTLEMVVPGHAVGKVMGKGGANIGNIRKISGAVVEISESKSSRGDRVAVISGTPEQKRAAENLIQAFIMAT